MALEPFALDRLQSTHEHRVELQLSESGVPALSPGDLLDDEASRDAFLREGLRYQESNGTADLRALVASLHPGATAREVLITTGGAEANCVALWSLVAPGDEVVSMVPGYLQAAGLARGLGAVVREWPLMRPGPNGRWLLDVEVLAQAVTPRTRLIVLCHPNNPTGARFEASDLDRVAAIAGRHGIWILSDEIYRGAEHDGRESASMWGRTERVVVTGGLSKAYALPGLRVGWIVGPPPRIASCAAHRAYTTGSPGALGDFLARRALEPSRRRRILARTRRILNENFAIVARWLDDHARLFDHAAPDAGAIVSVRCRGTADTLGLARRLRQRKSVLVVPGEHFGLPGWLRIGFGQAPAALRLALDRVHEFLLDPSERHGVPAPTDD